MSTRINVTGNDYLYEKWKRLKEADDEKGLERLKWDFGFDGDVYYKGIREKQLAEAFKQLEQSSKEGKVEETLESLADIIPPKDQGSVCISGVDLDDPNTWIINVNPDSPTQVTGKIQSQTSVIGRTPEPVDVNPGDGVVQS